jgi:hypothetical protein
MNPMAAHKFMGGSIPIHFAFMIGEAISFGYYSDASSCDQVYFDWVTPSAKTAKNNFNDI